MNAKRALESPGTSVVLSASQKSARINLRLPLADRTVLAQAARAQGLSLAQFILKHACDRALEVVAMHEQSVAVSHQLSNKPG